MPAQVIGGKAPACIPKIEFQSTWHITYIPNHWTNEDSVWGYIYSNNVLFPCIADTHKLKLHQSFPTLVIFDYFSGQLTECVEDLWNQTIFCLSMCHRTAQIITTLDISVNKSIKASLKTFLSCWYAEKQQGDQHIHMRLNVLNCFRARWFVNAFQHIADNPKII